MGIVNPSTLAIDTDELVELQLRLNFRQRKSFAPDFARRVNQLGEIMGAGRADPALGADLAAALDEIGYARVGRMLSEPQVADILAHFSDRPCFNSHAFVHSDGKPSDPERLSETSHFGCYRAADVVTAPHILELANDPRILSAVEAYLGCIPALYSMNAWWSFPRPEGETKLTQTFHRDFDDFKNCVLFFYLTDVGNDGCHEYIRYSHRPDELARHAVRNGAVSLEMPDGKKVPLSDSLEELFADTGYGRDPLYRELFAGLIDSIAGSAGEGFLTDPDGLHRARHPKNRRRLIVWLRYGLHRNSAYVVDGLAPVARARVAGRLPDTAQARFVNRLVVEPN